MKKVTLRRLAVLVICVGLSSSNLAAGKKSTKPASTVEAGYAAALACANRFLHAWQSADQEAGLLLLSDAAKHHTTQEGLDNFFASGAGAAYEIGRGKKLKAGQYSFPVVLFQLKAGNTASRRLSQITVIRAGKDDWTVDKLP